MSTWPDYLECDMNS